MTSYYLRRVIRADDAFQSPRYCECGLTLVGETEKDLQGQWIAHLLEVVETEGADADSDHSMVAF